MFCACPSRPSKEEAEEELTPCPYCSNPLPATDLDCPSCKNNLPYCIVTVRRGIVAIGRQGGGVSVC